MDLVGPYAQSQDCPLEKFFRDAKIYQIFEGTAQVQRLVVSRLQRAAYQEKLKAAADIVEPAIEKAIEQSANALVVRHHDDLVPLGGIGAVLRF